MPSLWLALGLSFLQLLPNPQDQMRRPLQAKKIEGGMATGIFLEVPKGLNVLDPPPESVRTSSAGTVKMSFLQGEQPTAEVPREESLNLRKNFAGLFGFILIVGVLGPLAELGEHFRTKTRRQKVKLVVISAALAPLAWICCFTYLVEHNKTASLWIDNATPASFQVFASDEFIEELPARSHLEFEVVVEDEWVISRGLKEVEIRLEAEEGDPILVTLLMEKWGRYLYNVGGLNSYRVTSRSYR